MPRLTITSILLLLSISWCVSISCKKNSGNDGGIGRPVDFTVPQGWPAIAYNFDSNRLTMEGIALGRKLFYDGRLSKDGQVSCGSCHQQFAAFTTYDHDFSHGINNTHGTRNAPGLSNLAWQRNFMWDGSITQLDLQPLAHITAPTEMGETLSGVLQKLQADVQYRQMFASAFGDENITTPRLTRALSQFVLTMINNNSKYDKMKRGEATFNLAEGLGYDIFKAKCAACHAEPMFTDYSYRNIGLPLDPNLKDYGRMRVTLNSADSLKFKVPTLRNVEWSPPYGHDGRFNNLDLVMEHYRSKVVNGPTTDALVRNKIPLSNFEIGQLKAFLFTLTDSIFINNKNFSAP